MNPLWAPWVRDFVRSWRYLFRREWASLISVVVFLSLGLLIFYSASIYPSTQRFLNAHTLFYRQASYAILGFLVFVVFYAVPLRWFQKLRVLALLLGLLLLVVTLLFAPDIKGARRWIFIAGVSIQSSIIAWIAVLIFWANHLQKNLKNMHPTRGEFYLGFGVLALFALLIFKQPDWSTGFVMLASSMLLLLILGYSFRHFLFLSATVFVVLVLTLYILQDYHLQRILANINKDGFELSTNYQTNQAFLAIRSGGFWGRGFGEGVQKMGYLPEAHNDFIFAAMSEELGSVLAFSLLFLEFLFFAYLLRRAYQARKHCPFGARLVMGLVLTLIVSLLIHFFVNIGIFPVTGVSLPGFSYGGTGYLYLCLVLALSYRLRFERYEKLKKLR